MIEKTINDWLEHLNVKEGYVALNGTYVTLCKNKPFFKNNKIFSNDSDPFFEFFDLTDEVDMTSITFCQSIIEIKNGKLMYDII